MDARTLLQKSTPIEYDTVKGRCKHEDYLTVSETGITPDLVVEQAYSELAEQIRRDNRIKSILPANTVIKEHPVRVERGDGVIDDNPSPPTLTKTTKKVLSWMKEHGGEATRDDLVEHSEEIGFSPGSLHFFIRNAREHHLLLTKQKEGVRDVVYYLRPDLDYDKVLAIPGDESDDPPLVAPGTKISVQR